MNLTKQKMTSPNYRVLYPRQIILVSTAGTQNRLEKDDISTLAWSTPTSFSPELVAISVNNDNLTHKFIRETGEFVINIPTIDMVEAVLFCGTTHGENIDKFKEAGLTPIIAENVKPKLIKECIANIECRVVDSIKTGDHTLFIGKITAVRKNHENKEKILIDKGGRNFIGV